MADYFGNRYWTARYFPAGYWGVAEVAPEGLISANLTGGGDLSGGLVGIPTVVSTSGGGVSYTYRRVHQPRTISIDAKAEGQTLTCFTTLLPGKATAISLLAGKAFGEASAGNNLIAIHSVVQGGKATGEQNLSDEMLLIFAAAA